MIKLMIINPSLVIWDWSDTLVGYSNTGVLVPLPHASALLDFFHKRGVTQAVVSNGKKNSIIAVCEKLGWLKYINLVVGIDCGFAGKPDPEMVRHALEYFQISQPHTAILFGDTSADMEAGSSAGCSTFCVSMGLDQVWEFYNTNHI